MRTVADPVGPAVAARPTSPRSVGAIPGATLAGLDAAFDTCASMSHLLGARGLAGGRRRRSRWRTCAARSPESAAPPDDGRRTADASCASWSPGRSGRGVPPVDARRRPRPRASTRRQHRSVGPVRAVAARLGPLPAARRRVGRRQPRARGRLDRLRAQRGLHRGRGRSRASRPRPRSRAGRSATACSARSPGTGRDGRTTGRRVRGAPGPFGPLEMLDDVQRQAFEAAMRVAGELTALSGDLGERAVVRTTPSATRTSATEAGARAARRAAGRRRDAARRRRASGRDLLGAHARAARRRLRRDGRAGAPTRAATPTGRSRRVGLGRLRLHRAQRPAGSPSGPCVRSVHELVSDDGEPLAAAVDHRRRRARPRAARARDGPDRGHVSPDRRRARPLPRAAPRRRAPRRRAYPISRRGRRRRETSSRDDLDRGAVGRRRRPRRRPTCSATTAISSRPEVQRTLDRDRGTELGELVGELPVRDPARASGPRCCSRRARPSAATSATRCRPRSRSSSCTTRSSCTTTSRTPAPGGGATRRCTSSTASPWRCTPATRSRSGRPPAARPAPAERAPRRSA